MKTLLITLYGVFFLLFNTPNTDNFSIENEQLIWQKIYNTELSKEKLIKEIRNSGQFRNISINQENLTAEISELSLDFKGYGISRVGSPIYVSKNHIKSYVIVDFKDDQYRVTLKSMKLTPKIYGGEFPSRIMDMEEIALNKLNEEFDEKFLKKGSKIMDFTFKKITDFKETEEKDQW